VEITVDMENKENFRSSIAN